MIRDLVMLVGRLVFRLSCHLSYLFCGALFDGLRAAVRVMERDDCRRGRRLSRRLFGRCLLGLRGPCVLVSLRRHLLMLVMFEAILVVGAVFCCLRSFQGPWKCFVMPETSLYLVPHFDLQGHLHFLLLCPRLALKGEFGGSAEV